MADIKDLLNIFQQSSNLPKEVGHTIAKHESNLGKYSDTMEDIGVTKGVFHITKKAATSVMTSEEKEATKNMSASAFANMLSNTPELDASLSGRFAKKEFDRLGPNKDALNENEKASIVSNLYNFGGNTKLIDATKEYAKKKKEYKNPNDQQIQELREAAEKVKSKMNITKVVKRDDEGKIVYKDGKKVLEVHPTLVKRRKAEKEQFSTLPEGARSLLESGSTGLVGKILEVDNNGSVSIKDRLGKLEDIADPRESSSEAINMIIDSMGSKEERDYIVKFLGEDKVKKYAEQGILEDRIVRGVMMNRNKYGSMEAAVKEISKQDFMERLTNATKRSNNER